MSTAVSISLAISFFIEGLRMPGYAYRTTLGLFKKGRSTPYIGAIVNIIFSIILGKILGVTGIFIATSIAQLCSYVWIDPYLIHKYEFNTSVSKYFKKYIIYFAVFIFESCIALLITELIKDNGLIEFFLKILIVVMVPNILNLLFFNRIVEYKQLKEKLFIFLKNK